MGLEQPTHDYTVNMFTENLFTQNLYSEVDFSELLFRSNESLKCSSYVHIVYMCT